MAAAGTRPEPPLVVIVGPTASGKTSLAIRIAKEYSGEIISADSRAIYRGLDIGTAKPTVEERASIAHWGIDLVDPGERFTAADFKKYALEKITDIRQRGKIPILVGGTGLYIDAVIYDFEFTDSDYVQDRRSELEALTIDMLHEYCRKNSITLPENAMNKRYVVNNILRNGQELKRRKLPIDHTIIVGITTEKSILRDRIHKRAAAMFKSNVIDEAATTGMKHGWDNEAMTGNVYPLIRQFLAGNISKQAAIDKFEILDWRLAKRQLTWLRRNEHIKWFGLDDAYTYLVQSLADVFSV